MKFVGVVHTCAAEGGFGGFFGEEAGDDQDAECDLVVCWQHDWAECPVEVLELAEVVRERGR